MLGTKSRNLICKIHGTGADRNTDKSYKKMYELLLTTKMTPEVIARETVKEHPVFQSGTYKKEKDSKIKGIKQFLKKGDQINKFTFKELTLYIFRFNDDYLIINTKKLHKGQFGNYLNLKQFSTNKVLFAIFTPCDFMSIVKFILEKPELETKIIRKIKYRYPINLRIIYQDLEAIHSNIIPEYDPFSETIQENPFDLMDNTTFESFFTKKEQQLGSILKETLESLTRLKIFELNSDTWERIGYAFNEEKITPDEFIDAFAYRANLPKLIDYHFDYLIQQDLLSVDLYAQATEKRKLRKKFVKMINFDKSRFQRIRKELPKQTYDLLKPKTISERVKHDLIKKYVNDETFTRDGFTYTYSVSLPALDFSANLLSEQNKYYSQAIINVGLTASYL